MLVCVVVRGQQVCYVCVVVSVVCEMLSIPSESWKIN